MAELTLDRCKVYESNRTVVASESGIWSQVMAAPENARRRLRIWNSYQVARRDYLTQCDGLRKWGTAFSEVGEKLSYDRSRKTFQEGELAVLPNRKEFAIALRKFKDSIAVLERAMVAAREAGFRVTDSDQHERKRDC